MLRGLLGWIRGLLTGGGSSSDVPLMTEATSRLPTESLQNSSRKSKSTKLAKRFVLSPTRRQSGAVRTPAKEEIVRTKTSPYRFARLNVDGRSYLDLSRDGHDETLASLRLPQFHQPEQLATWLKLPLGKIAWLTERFTVDGKPLSVQKAHYHFIWRKKRSGSYRLIESPKSMLRAVQDKILAEILEKVAVHPAVHGFVPGRSIVTNAQPHVGQAVVVKFDLDNFYRRIRFARIVAIYRALGYSREMGIWLARLTTSSTPSDLNSPIGEARLVWEYLPRHLPQGSPTSPYLANLCAYGLDVRLAGLAARMGGHYTRYADDLTFSGDEHFSKALSLLLPLVRQIIVQEGFAIHWKKTRILRPAQKQMVTGVVVNEKINPSRREYDRLKAILHNCCQSGPSSQNRENRENFSQHLLGRISHVRWLNEVKGEKLMTLYQKIDWTR